MEATEIRILILSSILLLGLFGVFIIAMFLLFKKKQLAHQKKLRELEKASLNAQIEIQDKIFRDTSRELHDNVGQLLALVNLNLRTMDTPSNSKDQKKIEQSKAIMGQIIDTVRNISKNMNSDKILEGGLIKAFETELEIIKVSGNYETEFTTNTKEIELPDDATLIVFRIVQETLHNIIKHANATKIKMSVEKSPAELAIYINDNGKGFDYRNIKQGDRGQGIRNIENRAQLINAVFIIKSNPGEGTSITLTLNINNK